jgi:acetamidase/formamidase
VGPGGHILTGPIAIWEAEPGDVLEAQILKVDIDVDFACNGFFLGYGFLPMEYPYTHSKIIPLDRKRMIGTFAPGIELPLAGQGNGEVDIEALETYLTGTFRFIVHKNRHLIWPRAETPEYFISMGFSRDLKEATEHAVRDIIDFLMDQKHLSRDDAYMLTSVAVDVAITQLVDGNVGVHALLPKKIFTAAPPR